MKLRKERSGSNKGKAAGDKKELGEGDEVKRKIQMEGKRREWAETAKGKDGGEKQAEWR